MSKYLLLRDHIIWGPYSIEELRAAGIRMTDLIWVNGISTAWRFPDEFEEVLALIRISGGNTGNNGSSSTDFSIRQRESTENKSRYNGNGEGYTSLPQEAKINAFQKKYEENELYRKEQPVDTKNINAFTQRYPDTKNNGLYPKVPDAPSISSNKDTERTKPFEGAPPVPNIIKVVIADDHTLFREGVKMALSQKNDINVMGEAENGMQLLHLLKHNQPDVILLDITMPVMDGISALTSIRNRYTDMKVIMLSMHNDPSMVSTLMETGANAYLTKMADSEIIYEAIKTVYSKSYYFNELTNISMLEKIRSANKGPEMPVSAKVEPVSHVVNIPEIEEKPDRHNSIRINKRLFFAICLIVLIVSGIAAIIYFLGNSSSNSFSPPPPQNTDQTGSATNPANIPGTSSATPLSTDTSAKTKMAAGSLSNAKSQSTENKTDSGTLLKNTSAAFNDKTGYTSKTSKEKSTGQATAGLIPSAAGLDSNNNLELADSANKRTVKLNRKKALVRKNIQHLVTAFVNNYHVAQDGGISGIEFKIYNQTSYRIDQVVIEVKYLLPDMTVYKTEIVNSPEIEPLSSRILQAPESTAGVKVKYSILSVNSKELGL